MDEELDYYELYGVEKPDGEGAEPEADPEETEEPEVEDGDEVTEEETEEGGEAAEEDDDPAEEPAQEPEKVDLQQEIDRIKREQQAVLDGAIAKMGLKNPYKNGEAITTQAGYEDYLKAHNAARLENLRKQSGMSQEEFDELIGSMPEIQEARAAQKAAQLAAEENQRQQAERQLAADLKAINALMPEIRDEESMMNHSSWPKIRAMMENKVPLMDAFKSANADELLERAAKGVRRQSGRNRAGKNHLNGSGSKGSGGVSVPAEVMREYRRYMPNATEAQIQKHYAKRHKA